MVCYRSLNSWAKNSDVNLHLWHQKHKQNRINVFPPIFSLTASAHVNLVSVITDFGHFELVIEGGQFWTQKKGNLTKNLKNQSKMRNPPLGWWLWDYDSLNSNKKNIAMISEQLAVSRMEEKWNFWEKSFYRDVQKNEAGKWTWGFVLHLGFYYNGTNETELPEVGKKWEEGQFSTEK